MKLWFSWMLLFAAGIVGVLSIWIWPQMQAEMQALNLGVKAHLTAAFFIKPFHYTLSFGLLLLFLMMMFSILSRVIYEFRIAYLFRSIPYEPLFLLILSSLLYIWMLVHFPYLLPILTAIGITSALVHAWSTRKEEVADRRG